MTSMYLNITTDPVHLIGAAQGIAAEAESLAADMGTLLGNVEAHEGADVIGPKGDSFRDSFDKSYERTETPNDPPAHEAAKQGARAVAERATVFGPGVTDSMMDYMTQDGLSQAAIDSIV